MYVVFQFLPKFRLQSSLIIQQRLVCTSNKCTFLVRTNMSFSKKKISWYINWLCRNKGNFFAVFYTLSRWLTDCLTVCQRSLVRFHVVSILHRIWHRICAAMSSKQRDGPCCMLIYINKIKRSNSKLTPIVMGGRRGLFPPCDVKFSKYLVRIYSACVRTIIKF